LRLLFDQNLSYRLCRRLADLFAGSEQAVRAGLAEADDVSIWTYAARHDLTIVTHDADFAELAALRGPPPKIIWLRCGNRPTDEIEKLIRARAPTIRSFIEDEWAACLEVY